MLKRSAENKSAARSDLKDLDQARQRLERARKAKADAIAMLKRAKAAVPEAEAAARAAGEEVEAATFGGVDAGPARGEFEDARRQLMIAQNEVYSAKQAASLAGGEALAAERAFTAMKRSLRREAIEAQLPPELREAS